MVRTTNVVVGVSSTLIRLLSYVFLRWVRILLLFSIVGF